jgi:mRNA-degrading endonuclease RelE of RelBE toxin-antitoxin system
MKIDWADEVRRKLRALTLTDHEAIVASVERFAAEQPGVTWEPAVGSLQRRLRVGRYVVVMVLTPDGRQVSVVKLYRAER